MRTCICQLTLAAIAALAVPAAAPDDEDYEPADYMPLAVGNSWTFQHIVHDRAVIHERGRRRLPRHSPGRFQ